MDVELREYLDNAFGMVSREFQRLHQRIDAVEQRMARLEQRIDALERRVDQLETRTDQGFVEVSIRFKSVEARLETLEKSMTDMREQMFLLTPRISGVESRLGQLVLRQTCCARQLAHSATGKRKGARSGRPSSTLSQCPQRPRR